ncbi:class I SAM-dependent methyltransferase [Rosistilla oblonga]|uniref:Cypemycin methyltransferase n=1 Tax=Rosistilla oblonga TaxID=2527990 RepID=A0A518IWP4_9BACT|nr:class I SAM-dependent methyltransferase [Rosistilla oblonga]QDV57485.1 Cypemycin methyltransferase [Rosistilla oblonga]
MQKSLYDYPQYYDLAFRDETDDEADFIEAAWAKFGDGPLKHLLEPGCGSGRLVVELARRGYDVTGFDLSEPALRYTRSRLRRIDRTAEVLNADMIDFSLPRKFDMAYCTMNTFRHLLTENDARSHLQMVADHLRPGGLYLLGFHLMPPDADEECIERWRGSSGKTSVCFTLRVLDFCRRTRLESLRISMLAKTPRGEIRGRSEFQLRLYKAAQFKTLIAKVPDLELLEVFDFDYDIDEPQRLDNELADAVFVFRRRDSNA